MNVNNLSNAPDIIKVFKKIFRKRIHLCKECTKEFATCHSKPVFSIEKYPDLNLKGAEADEVVECNAFVSKTGDKK